MSKRRAIILLFVLLLGVVALLSLAAYTVQRQNDINAENAASFVPAPSPVTGTTVAKPATDSTPVVENDGIDIDTTAIEYKTAVGNGFSFEVPISWNVFQKTVNNCTATSVTDGKQAKIDVWPDQCMPTFISYDQKIELKGYVVAVSGSDLATYQHAIATFQTF